MSGGQIIALEALLLIGAFAAFVVWQMRDLRKARLEREAKERDNGSPST